jgi:hypothetical protein
MRTLLVTLFLTGSTFILPATAQDKPLAVVPEVTAPPAPNACAQITAPGDALVCLAKSHIVSKAFHFYTGEYTSFSEVDFGPRYDPRNYAGYAPIAADMCKRFAPAMKDPVINFTEFKSISGGCCGYAFFVMSCSDIE